MVSPECTDVGNRNRKRFDAGSLEFLDYPEACECACAHEMPLQWEKSYNVPQPRQAVTEVKVVIL